MVITYEQDIQNVSEMSKVYRSLITKHSTLRSQKWSNRQNWKIGFCSRLKDCVLQGWYLMHTTNKLKRMNISLILVLFFWAKYNKTKSWMKTMVCSGIYDDKYKMKQKNKTKHHKNSTVKFLCIFSLDIWKRFCFSKWCGKTLERPILKLGKSTKSLRWKWNSGREKKNESLTKFSRKI